MSSMKLLVGTASSHFHQVDYNGQAASLSVSSSTKTPQPGWLHREGETLYAVSETEGQNGQISKFQYTEESGWQLSWRSECSSEGTCHCSCARVGSKTFVLAANYVGHTTDVFDEEGNRTQSLDYTGSGPFEGRQESSHCHQIIQDLQQEFVYVNDLGGDKLHRYRIDTTGKLNKCGEIIFEPAQGPRHCAFNAHHPDLVYVICELSNEITVFRWTKTSGPELLQTISVLPDASMKGKQHAEYPQPASAGEIQITSDGKFLYASTRYLPKYNSDTILFAPLDSQGLLGSVKHIDTNLISPWHFSLSRDEKFVAVAFKDSNAVRLYSRDLVSGDLSEIAALDSGIETPSCVLFL